MNGSCCWGAVSKKNKAHAPSGWVHLGGTQGGVAVHRKRKEEGATLITKGAEQPFLSWWLTASWQCRVELPTVQLADTITTPQPVPRPWCHGRVSFTGEACPSLHPQWAEALSVLSSTCSLGISTGLREWLLLASAAPGATT